MAGISVNIFNNKGEKVGSELLNPDVFGVPFKDAVVHQVVIAQESSARPVLAHTKGRGEVRGGGKKPWKQKGTGRARHGSRRSPIWVGGGITFGPTKERNFKLRINKKMRQQALRMVLSDKVKNEHFIVIDELALDDGKTKKLNAILKTLPTNNKKINLITSPKSTNIIQAGKNLVKTTTLNVQSLNVVDLLKRPFIVIPKNLISEIEKTYGRK